jgi:hypothetical protein
MRPIVIVLGLALVLAVSGCGRSTTTDDEGRIDFGRNSEFAGPKLRVFLTLDDGREVSVNTTDDAVDSRSALTPIPGHQARDWTFIKDGPEIDPATPPELPLAGQATYVGQAGGLYTYVPGSDWGEDAGAYVIDEYEGVITITADFADATLSGCIACTGDLVTRRAHFGIFLGDEVRDVRAIAAHYELHLGATPFNLDGTFEHVDVTVKHPERTITHSEGHWGGSLSNIPALHGQFVFRLLQVLRTCRRSRAATFGHAIRRAGIRCLRCG